MKWSVFPSLLKFHICTSSLFCYNFGCVKNFLQIIFDQILYCKYFLLLNIFSPIYSFWPYSSWVIQMHFYFPSAIFLKLPHFFYGMLEIVVPCNRICCILLYLRFQCLVLCISPQSWRSAQASPWPAWWARDSLTRNLRSRASRTLCSITYLTLLYSEFLRGKKKTQEKQSLKNICFCLAFSKLPWTPPRCSRGCSINSLVIK